MPRLIDPTTGTHVDASDAAAAVLTERGFIDAGDRAVTDPAPLPGDLTATGEATLGSRLVSRMLDQDQAPDDWWP